MTFKEEVLEMIRREYYGGGDMDIEELIAEIAALVGRIHECPDPDAH